MTKQNSDNLTPEELERGQAAPRRGGTLKRVFGVFLVLAVVLGIVAFAAYRDLNSFDSVRRLLSYNKVEQDEQGRVGLYSYDADRTNVYALLGERLVVASTTKFSVLANDGTQVFSQSVRMTNPAIAVGARAAVVYDVGGVNAFVVGEKGLVRDCSALCDEGILAASLNESDYLTLTTERSGYKSVVSVYDPTGTALFAFNSSDSYVLDACVLRDCKHLAAVTAGETDGVFSSTLNLYSLSSETAEFVNVLSGSLVLSLSNMGTRLAALGDDRLTIFDADGPLAGSYRYEYPYLRSFSTLGANYDALLLSRYKSGSTFRLVTVSQDGETLGAADISREVLGVSAAGKYVAVLCSDALTVYTSDLNEYAVLEDTNYAKGVIMRDDGTALLLGTSGAWLYIP